MLATTIRTGFKAALLLALFGIASAHAQTAAPAAAAPVVETPAPAPLEAPPPNLPWIENYVEGNPAAPLEITEYFSPNCTHCGEAFLQYHPWLLKNYIQTGYISIRYKEIYFSDSSKRMVSVVHCLPKEDFLDILEHLYIILLTPGQKPVDTENYIASLWAKYHMSAEDVTACVNNVQLSKWRDDQQTFADDYMGIKNTHPVYIFGNSSYRFVRDTKPDVLKNMLDVMLKDKQPAR